MPEQILQALSDERKELLRENQSTQQIPKEPHPRATPQTKTDLTRDDKLQNPDPSTPTVAAKETRVTPAAAPAAKPGTGTESPKTEPTATAAKSAAAEGAPDKNAD